jgi:ATP-dependent DNA helicase RecG
LAYLRQYDGTYPLSEQEAQAFLANRGQPGFDLVETAATLDDLDQESLASFVRGQRSLLPVFAGLGDEALLRHARVAAPSGSATVAGLLAFGVYPQGVLPATGIQASCWSGPAKQASSALVDSAALVGSIPRLLDQAVAWVARNTPTAIEARPGGHLYDRPALPPLAVRELVANALVHRDLSPYAANAPVSLILEPGQLVITNPGGLFGLTVEALGHTDSHLRNPHLAQLLLSVRTPEGSRVIERLGSGIPRAWSALAQAGLGPPVFHDTGLRFTARILMGPPHGPAATATGRPAGRHHQRVRSALGAQPRTARELSTLTGLTLRQVRYALQTLVGAGQVQTGTTPGQKTLTYRLVSSPGPRDPGLVRA